MLDPVFQKQISNFITSQFPEVYQELGPVFIDFVREYYTWMENVAGNQSAPGTLYDSRRVLDYGDIDLTVDEFIIRFKRKYLQNIHLTTTTNTRMLVKHSLDVFRSRGTPRGTDLLFRLVFGTGADTYYPGDDVFRLSDGKWTRPMYLEVAIREDNDRFVGKDVIGLKSGAVAFVERYVRRKGPFSYHDVLYISARTGNFITGETINAKVMPFNPETCPAVVGSLTTLTVTSGSNSFNLGDIVSLSGTQQGYGAKGRVAQTAPLTGSVTFSLDEGGYAYQQNSLTLVSGNVLSVAAVQVGNNADSDDYFQLFDTIKQPVVQLNYVNGTGAFSNNDSLTAWVAGSPVGTGTVLGNPTVINSTAGTLLVAQLSGNLSANIIGNHSNVVLANLSIINGYFDQTATANVISESNTALLQLSNTVGTFQTGETLLQGPMMLGEVFSFSTAGANTQFNLVNTNPVILGQTVTGETSGATGVAANVFFQIGVINANNSFVIDSRAPFTSLANSTGQFTAVSAGTGASFKIGTLIFPENILLNTDYIIAYANVPLNANGYGFPAFPSANLTTLVANALTYVSYTIGSVASLSGLTPGAGYTLPPFCRIFEPLTAAFLKVGFSCNIGNLTGAFAAGEEVVQTGSGARAQVIFANATNMFLNRLSFFTDIANTGNTTLTGSVSGATATVSYVEPLNPENVSADDGDLEQEYDGLNASLHANAVIANGSVVSLQVADSGFGWLEDEPMTFTSADGTRSGTALAHLGTQGQGTGFWEQKGGFLSDQKKLYDGIYWQDFSYEVRSALTFDKYSAMLRRVLHVSGTNPFGALHWYTQANSHLDSQNTVITSFVSNLEALKFDFRTQSQYIPLL